MNSRDYKMFRSGEWYHLYNRGNNKQDIFIDALDFKAFLQRLAFILGEELDAYKTSIRPFKKESFSVMAYCIMPNHFHILIKQLSEISLAKLMAKLCTSYAKYFNARYKHVGNLFQDAFKAKHVMNDDYLTYLSAYIHNNPSDVFGYPHSSINEYLGNKVWSICDTAPLLKYFNNDIDMYKKFINSYTYSDYKKIKELTFED